MMPVSLMVASYLLGAVPFGLYIARWMGGVDVRKHGSGNIGATNVYRVVGKPAGALVFVLDVGKGLAPPLIARALGLGNYWQVGAGLAAFVGHNASPFLSFHGGKGIATAFGVLLGVAWQVGLGAWALWAALLLTTGYVSLGSIVAALSLAPQMILYYPGDAPRLGFAVLSAALAIYKHRSNIRRLRQGTEYNFRRKR